MRMYKFTDPDGNTTAINLADIICVTEVRGSLFVTLRGMESSLRIPNKTFSDLLNAIEDYACGTHP